MKTRDVIDVIKARRSSDGDGVKINRVISSGRMIDLDPFLMLDEINSDDSQDYIGGFPPHPHRGFETVTYMRKGAFRHKDHLGNNGVISAGGAQWMTAGSGVIHSEMPEQEEGELHGFQIWLNLPAKDKMQKARYRDIQPSEMPGVRLNSGIDIKVLAGDLTLDGTTYQGPIRGQATDPIYWDLYLPQGEGLTVPLKDDYNGYIYLYEGSIRVKETTISSHSFARLSAGDEVTMIADTRARLLVLAGKAINEPIANYGPFVMNTREEIDQALQDYQDGTLTDDQHVA